MTEPARLLWQDETETLEPCLRLQFKMLLSQNDLVCDIHIQTSQIKKWNGYGETRLIETCHAMGLPIEHYREKHEYVYRGKAKYKWLEGNRLKEYLFTEPFVIFVRYWKSSNSKHDIDNVHLKAVIDGFVSGRLCPNDTTDYIRGVFRWHEGVDASLSLTKAQKDARRTQKTAWVDAGKKKSLPPPPNKRIYLDFYRLSRLTEKPLPFFFFTRLT